MCSTMGTPRRRSRLCAALEQKLAGIGTEVWVVLAVAVGPPVRVPSRVHQHRGTPDVAIADRPVEPLARDGALRPRREAHAERGKPGHAGERQGGEILAVLVPVERRVEVSAGISDQVDPTYLKRDPFRIPRSRSLSIQVVADQGGRETRIGDHAVFHRV